MNAQKTVTGVYVALNCDEFICDCPSENQPSSHLPSMANKIGWKQHNNFIFAEIADQASLNHCCKFELCATFQKDFTDLYVHKIVGVN